MSDEIETSSGKEWKDDDSSIFNDNNLDIDKKYLTLTEEVICTTNVAELENAIALCKETVISRDADSPDRNMLVRRLIELRLRLHHLQEALKDENKEDTLTAPLQDQTVVLGHHFLRQSHPNSISTYYCDRCSGVIWNAIHSWHLCTDCDYRCHTWCLSQVCRVCAHVVVTESPQYESEICPEAPDGLAAQNYRCAECLARTQLGAGASEPRRCDYTGRYYCSTCHWNSMAVIPARVISNWDFTERQVCRATKQRLRILDQLPILCLETLNPMLFASVDELISVKILRQRLLLMKKYLTSCKVAMEIKLAWQLKNRFHFLEGEDKYSLQDLIDLRSGGLISDLTRLMSSFERHITRDCSICKGQGFYCEACEAKEIIFPFSPKVASCPKCGSAYHLPCWLLLKPGCLKCCRRQVRLSLSEAES